jgi:hypothetical protein
MRKVALLMLVVAVALSLALVGAGWKWGSTGHKQAGWTWDEAVSSYVWADI